MRRVMFAITLLAFIAVPPAIALGVNPQQLNPAKPATKEKLTDNPSPEQSIDDIEETIKHLKNRLEISKDPKNEQKALRLGVTPKDLQKKTAILRELLVTQERMLTAVKKKATLKQEKELLEKEIKSSDHTGLEPPPYTLSFYDELLDKLATPVREKEAAELAVRLTRRSLEIANDNLAAAQKEARRTRDQMEKMKGEPGPALSWTLKMVETKSELMQALAALEKINLENHLQQVKLAEMEADLIRKNLTWVRAHLAYDQKDLRDEMSVLESQRLEVNRQIQGITGKLKHSVEQWQRAQRLALQEKDDLIARTSLMEHEAWREAYQIMLEQAEETLSLLERQKYIQSLRYQLIKGDVKKADLKEEKENTEASVQSLQQLLKLQQNYQFSLQSRIMALEEEIANQALADTIRDKKKSQLKAFQNLAESRSVFISRLLRTEQLENRLLDGIDAQLKHVTVADTFERIKKEATNVWHYEVWVIDDQPVTVAKIIVALIILTAGIFVVKKIIQNASKKLAAYTHLSESAASAIGKIFSYLAYLIVVVMALRIVNMPIGAFAFLGGALAIGVGFGAQNIINNFISGFIMMAERPISVGDLVEVDGVTGKVEDIGARCTQVRTGENIHILVPNSSFLEKNITNWTFADRQIRTKIIVGVVYGSPVRRVEELLMQAVAENRRSLKEPVPFVLFKDFGNNALIFELYFWISVKTIIERYQIESDVRFRIDELFRLNGVVIAFPQRDVHLDADNPLEVRVISDKSEER